MNWTDEFSLKFKQDPTRQAILVPREEYHLSAEANDFYLLILSGKIHEIFGKLGLH
ncbi:hypothetical protein L8106_07114 [Lyngbya sp. PCC 8106]|nr:hypothetical protein L8106_07114 [Lyngbya sp. PCC 8106]